MVRQALHAALDQQDTRLRWGAAYTLARRDDLSPRVVQELVRALGSSDPDVRWAALDLLTKPALREAVSLQAEAVLGMGDDEERKMMAHLLRRCAIRSPELERLLLTRLDSGGPAWRVAAINYLAVCFCNREVVSQRLVKLLRDSQLMVARAAALALGYMDYRDTAVRASLEEARRSKDSALRRAAERALAKLESQDADSVLPPPARQK
jgi:HEAT repeat protein